MQQEPSVRYHLHHLCHRTSRRRQRQPNSNQWYGCINIIIIIWVTTTKAVARIACWLLECLVPSFVIVGWREGSYFCHEILQHFAIVVLTSWLISTNLLLLLLLLLSTHIVQPFDAVPYVQWWYWAPRLLLKIQEIIFYKYYCVFQIGYVLSTGMN